MLNRLPRFPRSARGLLNAVVVIKAAGSVKVSDLKAGVFPSSAFDNTTIAGRFTSATMLMFCKALDGNGQKYDISKEYTVEETTGAMRKWIVSDDPENYQSVYLLVPLRPQFASY